MEVKDDDEEYDDEEPDKDEDSGIKDAQSAAAGSFDCRISSS